MFTSPVPAATSLASDSISLAASPTPLSASASSASAPAARLSSTASTSRARRGLSYLRSYTHNHLLSRDHNSTSSNTNPQDPPSRPSGLSRSLSYTPRTTNTTTPTTPTDLNPSTASRRFTLVPTLSHSLDPSRTTLDDEQASQNPTAAAAAATRSGFQEAPSTGTAITTLREEDPAGRRSMTRSRSATTGSAMPVSNDAAENGNLGVLPSIRFSVFVDPRSQRPSLHFSPVSRTLPSGNEVIRVGRYSERDSQPAVPANVPSSAPVGFKSKVVSRRHCEFWYEEGKWYIRDVKSSSGTFLNHIRLSPPGQESKPFPVNDGDVVQLGIDFKGGEEMIFRCVKMRLELNRGWQNKLNKFKYVCGDAVSRMAQISLTRLL